MKKTVISIMIILCVILSSFTFVSAEDAPVLFIRAGEWNENNEFELFVSFKNNPGISAFDFGLDFDGKLIQPVKVEKSKIIEGFSVVNNLPVYEPTKEDILRIACLGLEDFTSNEDVCKISFKVSDYASSENSGQEVTIKALHNTGIYNLASEEIEFNFSSCSVVLPEIPEDKIVLTPSTDEEKEDIPQAPTEGEAENIPQAPTGGSRPNIPTATPEATPDVTMVLVIGSVEIKANANTIINDVAPKVVNDITSAEGNVIEFVIGESVALVNGEEYILDSPAFIENDRTYSPVRFVSEQLLADVEWNEDLQQVTITK